MKFANYIGVKNKKPIKAVAYFEGSITSPLFFSFEGATFKRKGETKDTNEEPKRGDILFSNFSKEDLDKKSSELGKKFYEDIQKSPDSYEENIVKFDEKHWVGEYRKLLQQSGNITRVS